MTTKHNDFRALVTINEASSTLRRKMEAVNATHAHQYPNGGDVHICTPDEPRRMVGGTWCP